MKEKKKWKKWVVIAIVLAIIIGLYLYISTNAKKAIDTISKSYIVENSVQKGDIEVKITGSGVCLPVKRQEIFAATSGIVDSEEVKLDEKVEVDDVLFVIGGYNVRTKIDGKLITKNVEEGDYVEATAAATTKPIAVVADTSKMITTLKVDELDISKIKIGMEATINCEATGNKKYKGKVTKISAEGESQNGVTTYDVTIQIDKPQDLKIGMNLDIEVIVEKKQSILTIPMEAISTDGDNTYVYVKDENDVEEKESKVTLKIPSNMSEVKGYKKQQIETGIYDKQYIEVKSGLKENDKIYSISNSKTLQDYMMDMSSGNSSAQSK